MFTSLVLFKMLSSKAPLLFCQNPFCLKFNKKPFSNQAAYTQHIDRNIGCYNFIVKKSHLAATHGASVSHRRFMRMGMSHAQVTKGLLPF
jgi:hypothetical protein